MPVELGSFIPSFFQSGQAQANPWSIGPVFMPETFTLSDKWGDSALPWAARKIVGEGLLDPLADGQKKLAPAVEARPGYRSTGQFLSQNKALANWGQNLIKQHAYLQEVFPDKASSSFSSAARNAFGGTSTYTNLANTAAGTAVSAIGYTQLLGLDSQRVAEIRKKAPSFTDAVKKTFNPKEMGSHARSALRQGEVAGASALKNFFRKVVINQNIKNVLGPLSEGRLLVGGLMSLSWLMMGASVFQATGQAYSNAMDRDEGFLKALWDGGKTMVTKGIKMLAAWEMAGLGYALGTALFTLATGVTGGLALLAIGIGVGALFSGMTHVALSKIIPEPERRVS